MEIKNNNKSGNRLGMERRKKTRRDWVVVYKDVLPRGLRVSFENHLQGTLAKDQYTATEHDNFMALALTIRDRLVERWMKTQQRYHRDNVKRVYYFSMEFLIGRLLGNNMFNLGITEAIKQAMQEMGFDLDKMRDQEPDEGLGNGGLGRLAACFLDSLATLAIPAHGYGIRYEYGIFNQKIVDGYQVESPDEWLKLGNPWEFVRPEYAVKVQFYGRTNMFTDSKGKLHVRWVDSEDVLAMPYDTPVPGYKNDVVNTLRLWSARSTEEFDLSYFNYGDYERAVYNKLLSENISKVLYPVDNVSRGKELRLKQEYFFTAASISDIIRRFKMENKDILNLPEKVAIQLNDTHPSLAIVELLRILLDKEGMGWETAWDMTVKIFGYTNHTIMPEALESWPVNLLGALLPRHLQLIYEINFRFLQEVAKKFPGDNERLRRMSLIDESEPKVVRMAYLAIVGSHSVNGVSELHSRLLTEDLFKDFYEFWPEKFNNKTNGITQRRWLKKANSGLSDLITSAIGDRWITNLYELEKLLPLRKDRSFRQKWAEVKERNKLEFADYVKKNYNLTLDGQSLFDVQIKRIHEYKRQLLLSFYIISQYLKLKKAPCELCIPRTFIFGGKAAPGYAMAKLIIKFITSIGEVINKDKAAQGKIKVIFLENYRVSLAERIFPASDLSEQISTAGMEASGTGCMKFMVNGALTIGTHDGANIEIADCVGAENIFTFGLEDHEIKNLKVRGYNPRDYVERSPILQEVFNLIRSNFFSPVEFGLFEPLVNSLLYADHFFVCADFDAYCNEQDKVSQAYMDKDGWVDKSIINVAKSGKFSSDRTIAEYARDIWKIGY